MYWLLSALKLDLAVSHGRMPARLSRFAVGSFREPVSNDNYTN